MTLKVFISYAKENKSEALKYFDKLEGLGLEPWLDEKKILPGEKWENAISDAFNNSHVIVLLISSKSVNKRGFVQREANWAMKKLEEKLDNDIYIIPIMIEPCEVPTNISNTIQYIDGTLQESWMLIISSLKKAAKQYGIPFLPEKEFGPYIVSTETLNDTWSGKPGYDTEIDYPIFKSSLKNIEAKELSNYFYSRAQYEIVNNRESIFEQNYELFDDFMINNLRREHFNIEYANSNIISLSYFSASCYDGLITICSVETFNFDTRDGIRKIELQHIIKEKSFPELRKLVINSLCKEYWNKYKILPDSYKKNLFYELVNKIWYNCHSYLIGKEGLIFLFPADEITFLEGEPWVVEIPYYELRHYLKDNGIYNFLIQCDPFSV